MKIKKILIITILGTITINANAQYTQTERVINQVSSGLSSGLDAILTSQERKKQMEIYEREKAQYKPSFEEAYEEGKTYEEDKNYEEALNAYEKAATFNSKYNYTDEKPLSKKITTLYKLAGRTEDGASVMNNDKVTLADYSKYNVNIQDPIYSNKKASSTRIVRIACSNTETRIELEYEAPILNAGCNIKGKAYIKPDKGSKVELIKVENITIFPKNTNIPFPYQVLRFALVFPAIPENAKTIDLI